MSTKSIEPTHEENLTLLREYQGEEGFEVLHMTIVITIRAVAPDQVDEGYKKVIREMADALRKVQSTTH